MIGEGKLLILDGIKIIPPHSERRNLIEKLHSSHKAADMVLRTARPLFFWPGMSNAIKQYVGECEICKIHQNMRCKKKSNEPAVDVRKLEPLESVSTDIFYHGADAYQVVVDECSGYKCCWKIKDSSTKSVVNALETWFATTGIPVVICSDNGLAYRQSFVPWCQALGIQHHTSAPYHPESNGGVECGVRELKSLIKKTKAKGVNLTKLILELNNME